MNTARSRKTLASDSTVNKFLPHNLMPFVEGKMSGDEECSNIKNSRKSFTISLPTEEPHPIHIAAFDDQVSPARDFEEAVEATGFGLFNYLLILAVFPGGLANFFDTTAMSYVLPIAECDLQLTLFQKGMLNGAIYAGMISSAFLWGFLADTRGRRSLLIMGYFADSICNILSSISQSFYMLLAFKFLSGSIINGPFSIGMSYLAEFHGVKYRSQVLLWARIFPPLGSIILPGLAWIIIPQSWEIVFFDGAFVYNSWRFFILLCSLPAALACLAIFFLPESPRFLISQGRNDEALKIFQKMYSMNTRNPPETFPVKVLSLEGQKTQTTRSTSQSNVSLWEKTRIGWAQIRPLFHKPHLSPFLLIITIQFGGLLSMNTLRLWMPQLFTLMENFDYQNQDADLAPPTLCDIITVKMIENDTAMGDFNDCVMVSVHNTVYINSMIIAATTILGYMFAGNFINLIGEKSILLIAYIVPAVCVIALNWSPNSETTLTIFSIYMTCASIAATSIINFIIILVPTSLRAMAVSLTMCFGRIGALIGNLLFPILLNADCMAPFGFVGGFLLACFVLAIFIPKPPTKLM